MQVITMSADEIDNYVKIRESTAISSFKTFCQSIIEVFENEYLRLPNANNISRLLAMGEAREFLGMLGTLYCLHWKWKNCPRALHWKWKICPKAWHDQYCSHIKKKIE